MALPEEEYPEWLWSCLDGGKKSAGDGSGDSEGDLFGEFFSVGIESLINQSIYITALYIC